MNILAWLLGNWKLVGAALVVAALLIFGLYWRGEAYQARAEADLARAQISVLVAATETCKASVDQARRVGEAAIAGTAELVAAARRLKQPARHTIERIETILERPTPSGAD